ncbi:hypothetical protein [Aquisphaera insulae]|uniref:hypothetical protein n=1 Tax=Aquisphaera insulae TaxID=2712864 RepID=UPI0013EB2661|nr:hypothetical protein [Aquisphaera insulae]
MKIKTNHGIVLAILALFCGVRGAFAGDPPARDLYADTWVATDALGRTMPDFAGVGPVKPDQRRVVGMFYITWHGDGLAGLKSPYAADVSKILAAAPGARLDAKHPRWTEGSYHWGEPELGYFLSKDRFVIRRDMSMLADAGVDVLVMDVTNAVRYWDEWDVVFPVMQQMKAEGNQVPRFCFWAFNGPSITVVQDLYEKIYKAGRYRDLWFHWDGKPLLLYNGTPGVDSTAAVPQNRNPNYDPKARTDRNHPHYGDPDYAEEFYKDYTKAVKEFFTLRTMWWGYYNWAGKRFVGTEDNWSFGYDMGDDHVKAMNPKDLVSTHRGAREEAAVTPAQHPSSLTGKSWTREYGEPPLNEQDLPATGLVPWMGKTVPDPQGRGAYFQERWDEALLGNPQFLYLNDWNEWTAGKYQPEKDQTVSFMRRKNSYFFVDQYNAEFNRTIQPMKGGYTDNYYMQMAQNIRRYKGIRPIPELKGRQAVAIDGAFADWSSVTVEYRDTIGDTIHRDYPGYGGLHYKDESGRNDIVTCKVAVGDEHVAFYAETREPLTPHTGENWMLLFIDADRDHKTGWNGYDLLVNGNVPDDHTTTLMRYDPRAEKGPWVVESRLPCRYAGNKLELAIPRRLLGPTADDLAFDFHWCDHPADLKDVISLCVSGDSAPNRRFNYRCIWKR